LASDKTQHISQGLSQALHQLGLDQRMKQRRVINDWALLVGENISHIAKPDRIQDGVLFVRVQSMTWRTELLFQKQAILDKISDTLGKDLIKDIRFV
jgi:predicted nucleic acid-binding Zn ribbon protein